MFMVRRVRPESADKSIYLPQVNPVMQTQTRGRSTENPCLYVDQVNAYDLPKVGSKDDLQQKKMAKKTKRALLNMTPRNNRLSTQATSNFDSESSMLGSEPRIRQRSPEETNLMETVIERQASDETNSPHKKEEEPYT